MLYQYMIVLYVIGLSMSMLNRAW